MVYTWYIPTIYLVGVPDGTHYKPGSETASDSCGTVVATAYDSLVHESSGIVR
jgi:hypothetical protein